MDTYKELSKEDIQSMLDELKNLVLIVEDFTTDETVYEKVYEYIYSFAIRAIECKDIMKFKVRFKFKKDDEDYNFLELRHLIVNMVFWKPFIKLGVPEVLDKTYILDCTMLVNAYTKAYIDEKIIKPHGKKIPKIQLNILLSETIRNAAQISNDFNVIMAISISNEGFMDLANRCKRFDEILRTKIDPSMQPVDIENYLNELSKEQLEILRTEDNMLKPMIITGSGINPKQLCEFSINSGLKPSLENQTVPIPIDTNFLIGGLNNITSYYIDQLGGRKAAISNKTSMGKSGHFSRMVMLMTSDITLGTEERCDSVEPIFIQVKTNEHLKRLAGRYYIPANRLGGNYKLMNGDETYLIESSIFVKSPITCSGKNGICRTCYGSLSDVNDTINSIGALSGSKVTEPISQSILSTKHLLTTKSKKVEFNEGFETFFNISSNGILLNAVNESINFNDYSLVIFDSNIVLIDEYIDEGEFNTFTTIFHVKNKKTKEIMEFRENDERDLFFSKELSQMIVNSRPRIIGEEVKVYEIDFSIIDTDTPLFLVEIQNDEITKPLVDIMNLLNRASDKEVNKTVNKTVDYMSQTLLDLLIKSKINVMSIHGDIIIRPLVRSSKDILKIPNWSRPVVPDMYEVHTMGKSLTAHPSATLSLSFQYLNRQLNNPLVFRKTGTSFTDPYFKERL